MINSSKYRMLSVLVVVFQLVSCSGVVGPESDQISFDVQELTERITKKLVLVSKLDVGVREQITNNRVHIKVTIFYAVNSEELDKLKKSSVRNSYMSGLRGPNTNHNIRQAMSYDGKVDKIVLQYERQGESLWKLVDMSLGQN